MNTIKAFTLGLFLVYAPLMLLEFPLTPGSLAYAAPVTSITGSASTTLTGSVLSDPGPFGGFSGGFGLNTGMGGEAFFSTISIIPSPIVGPPGFTSFSISGIVLKDLTELPPLPGNNTGDVLFGVAPAIARVPTDPTLSNTLIITGPDLLLDVNTTLDFTHFSAGGDFTLTFRAASGIDLAGVIMSHGTQTAAVTGSFSEVAAVPAPVIGHGLPVLLAVGGILAGSRLWQRSKKV